MKIFNKSGNWTSKVNFVDENNILLGYDIGQSCCEQADWFISDEPQEEIQNDNLSNYGEDDLKEWVFDKTYFKEVSGNEFDAGGMVIFRITNGDEQKFIHLFNCHNGYYGHGFEFGDEKTEIQSGCL